MGVIVRRWSLGLACGGLLVVAFLPWVRSGERERNSFELLRSADRLDLIDGAVQRATQLGWLLMPVAVGVVVLALAWGRHRIGGVAALFAGVLASVVGALVAGSSLDTTAWPAVALGLGLVVVVLAILELVGERIFDRVSTKPAAGDVSAP